MPAVNNAPIMIRAVGNGYIVEPAPSFSRQQCHEDSEVRAFQTMAELQTWLSRHFTHREKHVAVDVA